jgi:hypothetical protein
MELPHVFYYGEALRMLRNEMDFTSDMPWKAHIGGD